MTESPKYLQDLEHSSLSEDASTQANKNSTIKLAGTQDVIRGCVANILTPDDNYAYEKANSTTGGGVCVPVAKNLTMKM